MRKRASPRLVSNGGIAAGVRPYAHGAKLAKKSNGKAKKGGSSGSSQGVPFPTSWGSRDFKHFDPEPGQSPLDTREQRAALLGECGARDRPSVQSAPP